MALVPDCAGARGFHDVWLLRKNQNYVAISFRFSDDVAFAWLNQPVESLVSTRGRRSGAFLPPEDASLIRHRVGQGDTFLVCEQDTISSDLQDCLAHIKWEEALGQNSESLTYVANVRVPCPIRYLLQYNK